LQTEIDPELEAISSELNRLQSTGQLQSKSTTKYDTLRQILGRVLAVESSSIYISTIDKAANSNARMQQMQIRTDVNWKVFVGICLKDDVTSSKTYITQTRRNLTMRSAPYLQGSLWIQKDDITGKWVAVRGIFLNGSDIALTAKGAWAKMWLQQIDQAKTGVEPPPSKIFERDIQNDELSHLPIDEMMESLAQGPGQIILAGPPGTGKSYAARILASEIVGSRGNPDDPNISFVQFHPNYDYEDFIEGFRPVINDTGHFQLKQTPGLLMSLVQEMAEDPEAIRVLVIDEMNRANLSRVFGEILFLLEYRDTEISLKTGTNFSLPSNLLIISTMNTSDRNIRSIDIALRRRFRYFEIAPSEQALRGYFGADGRINLLGERLYEGFTKLNESLTSALDRHHSIGHTFFMRPTLDSNSLEQIWKLQVGPLIEEYFFDQPDFALEFSLDKFFGE